MKKEIVINASKDRSRIAIVEGGQLSELYIENPDNVRTIGNIYLARIRKLMPAIRAAFVDIGQKQDAFLHFSDLTENLAGLLAAGGEAVPGVAPTLATAPAKRVGDDENEPEVSETLDLGEDDATEPERSRGRRPSRPRGRPPGGTSRTEEEEEQEEPGEGAPRRRLPAVIDLTRRTGRIEPPARPVPPPAARPSPEAPAAPEPVEAVAVAEAPEETAPEAPKPRSRSRAKAPAAEAGDEAAPAPKPRRSRSKKTAAEAAELEAQIVEGTAPAEAADGPSDAPAEEKPAPKPRRSRSKKIVDADAEPDAAAEPSPAEAPPGVAEELAKAGVDESGDADAEESDDASADSDGTRRRRRGRRGGRRRRRPGAGDGAGEDLPELSDTTDPALTDTGGDALPERAEPATRAPRAPRGRTTRSPESTTPAPAPARAEQAAPARSSRPVRAGGGGGRPEDLLRRDGRILVKVTKEPISAKGSRVSTDISLAGRFLVLVPAADYVAVSKKIESAKERRRLRSLAESLKPDGFGVIVRTVADGRDARAIDTDLRLLVDKWRRIETQLAGRPEPPVTLYEDVSMVSSIVRDLFTDDYDRILVDDPKVHRNLKAYIQAVAPHMAERVVLHKSNIPVFRAAGIERQVEEAFSSRVSLPTGGYLVIEHTEAMHVVDVNSGRAGRGLSQSENLLRVNMEAAKEVARQLRLRDLGGIIVVDFIDMYSETDRKKVYNALKDEFRRDRAVTKLLPMSDFGIIEITRQRLRPSLTQKADRLTDETPGGDGGGTESAVRMAAIGAGEISQPERRYEPERRDSVIAPEAVAAAIDAWLRHYKASVPAKYRDRPIALLVHPLLATFLRRGFPSRLFRWRLTMRGIPFHVEEDSSMDPLAFLVRDDKSGKSINAKYTAS